MENRVDKT